MMQLQTALVDCEMPQKDTLESDGKHGKEGKAQAGSQGQEFLKGSSEMMSVLLRPTKKLLMQVHAVAVLFASLPHWERQYYVPLTQQDSANIATLCQDITLHSVLYKELACRALQGTVWLTWWVCSPSHKATSLKTNY